MPTIRERLQEKIEKAEKWEIANPGKGWGVVQYVHKEPTVNIPKRLLESKAYRSLSRKSMLLHQDFLSKRIMKAINRNGKRVWVIENNGNIIFPYAEAVKKGYTRDQFRDGIDELQAKGLIDIKYQGKGGRKPAKGTGDVSRYFIDDRWEDYDTDKFRPPRNPRVKDTAEGRGWKLYHLKNRRQV